MKKFLDEIMKESDKGYIDDPEYIEVLAKRMINLTYDELSAAKGYNTAALISTLISANNCPACDFEIISFGDMLTLAVYNAYEYADSFSDKLANILRLLSSVNPDVKLFTSVSVRALMDFVDKKTGTDQGSSMYRTIEKYMEEDLYLIFSGLDETTTVKFLVNTLIPNMTNRPLSMSMEEFDNIVNVSRKILDMLIVKSLRAVFSEELDYKPIEKRIYENAGEEYIDWDALCEEFDEEFSGEEYEAAAALKEESSFPKEGRDVEGLPGFKEFYDEEEKEYYIMSVKDIERMKNGYVEEPRPELLPWDDIVQRIKDVAAMQKKEEENK